MTTPVVVYSSDEDDSLLNATLPAQMRAIPGSSNRSADSFDRSSALGNRNVDNTLLMNEFYDVDMAQADFVPENWPELFPASGDTTSAFEPRIKPIAAPGRNRRNRSQLTVTTAPVIQPRPPPQPTAIQKTALLAAAKLRGRSSYDLGVQDMRWKKSTTIPSNVKAGLNQIVFDLTTNDHGFLKKKSQAPDPTGPIDNQLPKTFTYLERIEPISAFTPKLIHHPRIEHRELGDHYYERAIINLYRQIESFVETHLCPPLPANLDTSIAGNSPWDAKWSPEFLNHVSAIARPDLACGGWERLLCDPGQRKHLFIGLIARVMEIRIFNQLLFGVEKYENDMLVLMEKTLVEKDGYERTALRAKTVSTILEGRRTTSNFDVEVLKLTTSFTLMIQPLIFWLAAIDKSNPPPTRIRPTLQIISQDLSDIFSQAAYLHLQMRNCSTIFILTSTPTDAPFDDATQHCIDHPYFSESKEAAGRRFNQIQSSPARSLTPGYGLTLRDFKAKTKIAVWPGLRRYKAGDGLGGGEKRGFRVFEVCKAGVVVYWTSDGKFAERTVALRKWVVGRRGGSRGVLARLFHVVFLASLFVAVLWVAGYRAEMEAGLDYVRRVGSSRALVVRDENVGLEEVGR